MAWNEISTTLSVKSPTPLWQSIAEAAQFNPNDWFLKLGKLEPNSFTVENSRRDLSEYSPTNKIENSKSLSYDELVSQAANRSLGFQIFDIDPKFLDKETYPCTMPIDYFGELVGFENSTATQISNVYPTTYYNDDKVADYVGTYYRTIAIDVLGNFLQIEYPGLASNDQNSVRLDPTGTFTIYLPSLKSYDETVPAPTPTGLDGTFLRPETSGFLSHEHVSKDVALLQFEDNYTKPHSIRSGDIFNTYFTRVYITVKMGSPKIRLTVGFNSQKTTSYHQTIANTQLHLAGSKNFVEKLNSPLVPFCISSANFGVTSMASSVSTLLVTQDLVQRVSGYGLLFVTGLSFSAISSSGANPIYRLRLYSSYSSSTYSKLFYEATTAGSGSVASFNIDFSVPIRISMQGNTPDVSRHGDIYLFIERMDATSNSTITFSVRGYSFGKLYQPNFFTNTAPFQFSKKLLDNQFINDFDVQGVS